jgi:hypothetical protein
VRARFDSGTNKTIATLRKDGSPRISAIEMQITDEEVTVGMMAGSIKLMDARRDPRVAIHSPTTEPPSPPDGNWPGDAKVAGCLVERAGPPDGQHTGAGYFSIDISEVVLTYVGDPADHLVIESWHLNRGWQRQTRY